MVAGVGGVGGELGVEDFRGVGHGAELGHAGRHGVVDAGVAVALHEGDVDADVRVGVGFYLDDVGLLRPWGRGGWP